MLLLVLDLPTVSNLNRLDAKSSLPENNCPSFSSNSTSWLICQAKQLPFRMFTFLFRPFPFLEESTSLGFQLASYENLLWVSLFVLLVQYSIKSRREIFHLKPFIFLSSYLCVFSILVSLFEGNIGTGFRHKSLILWVLVALISILVTIRMNQREAN